MSLNVYRSTTLVGTLDMRDGEPFYGFTYDRAYAQSPNATPLSLSLPLSAERYPGSAPAYDILCTTIYDGTFGSQLSRSMGIRMGDHLNIDRVTSEDFSALANVLRQPASAVGEVVDRMVSGMGDALSAAAGEATGLGFPASYGLAERIEKDASRRARVLLG